MTEVNYFSIGQGIARGDERYVMSRTELLAFHHCPDAWYRGRKFEGNQSTEFGSLVDTLLLTPQEFEKRYVIKPLTYPSPTKSDPNAMKAWNANSRTCKAFIQEAKREGKTVISEYDRREALSAVDVILKNEEARSIVSSADKQVVCRWDYVDRATGITVPMKCMLDLVGRDHKFLGDFKTCRNGDLDGFRKSGRALRYDVQVSLYAWGYRENYEDRDTWVFVCAENTKPYPVSKFITSASKCDETGRTGKDTKYGRIPGYEEMLRHYCHCLRTQKWPSYTSPTGDSVIPLEFFF
jgi:hypothetical protein